MHGLVPPHPGPLIAINALHADLGQTLAYGLLIAIPTVIIAGPLYGGWIGKRIQPQPPAHLVEQFTGERVAVGAVGTTSPPTTSNPTASPPAATGGTADVTDADAGPRPDNRPSFGVTLLTVLLPVVLMLGKAVADITLDKRTRSGPFWTSSVTR